MMRRSMVGLAIWAATLATGTLAVGPFVPAAQAATEKRALPYYGSIGLGRADANRPGPQLSRQLDLSPCRPAREGDRGVQGMAQVQDPDGTEGWMLAVLLRNTRTAIVRGTEPLPMRSAPMTGPRPCGARLRVWSGGSANAMAAGAAST